MFELIYTSAPKGILPGRTGFSTVAFTAGMPPNLLTPLENLSGYEFTFKGNTLPEECNPPVYSFVLLHYGSSIFRVASRIAPNGLDYTMRNNKIAHHILFERDAELERFPSGAAGIFGIPGNFEEDFQDQPHELPVRHIEECAAPSELPAETWKKFCADAGWAGVIAGRFLAHPEQPFFVEYPVGTSPEALLELLGEVTELLPAQRRKDFTFSTYFTRERPSEECFLRMVPAFSPLLGALKRFHPERVVTLGEAREIPAEYAASELVAAAREGRELPEPPIPPADVPKPLPPVSLFQPDAHLSRALRVERNNPSQKGRGMPPEPRSRITREYVAEKTPVNWKPWAIAVLALFFLIMMVAVTVIFLRDVDFGAVAQTIKERKEAMTPETPTADVRPVPAAPSAEERSAAPEKVPENTASENNAKELVPQMLPEEAQANLLVSLQALIGANTDTLKLPELLQSMQTVELEPAELHAILENGRLRFPTLSVMTGERRNAIMRIRRMEFRAPGKAGYVYAAPRLGHLTFEGESLVLQGGDPLPGGVAAMLGSAVLSTEPVLTLPVEKFNASVRKYDKTLQKFFDRTGAGTPYTKAGFIAALQKILPSPPIGGGKKPKTRAPEMIQRDLIQLIQNAPFGRFDARRDLPAVEMGGIITEELQRYYGEIDEFELSNQYQIEAELSFALDAAMEREKLSHNKNEIIKAKREVNDRLFDFKNELEIALRFPDKNVKSLLLKAFFEPLNVIEAEKGRRVAKEFDAPAELSGEILADFCRILDEQIQYEKH